ncbi:MAG: hypothetical protein L0229_32075 [Blastocatellia bacterium]|nr:hypothetical protein [Blastocatellia bacterium]
MGLARKYRKSLDEQWSLRFKTRHPDGDAYDGVVTHIKPGFIVLLEEADFEFDGFVILPKKYIKGFRDGKYERCCNQILRENGAIKKIRPPRWLDSCETIPQVLTTLMQRGVWPGVETIFNQGKKSAFYLGPITRVTDKRFFLKCYDAAGKWEGIYKLKCEEIFRIEFDSRYCKHFNAYMKSREEE